MSADELDGWLADARAGAERSFARPGRMDFADAVARAHELFPDRISSELVDEAESREDVIALDRGAPAQESALDALVSDARAGVLARIEERRLRAAPALRIAPAEARTGSRVATWIAAGVAAAALVAAFVTAGAVSTSERDADPVPDQAVHQGGTVEPGGDVQKAEVVSPRSHGTQNEAGWDAAELDPAPEPGSEANPPSEPAPEPSRTASTDDRRARLRDLSERAEQKWKAGDLAGAQSLYERVLAQGGRAPEAELAYADLFALTHQRGDASGRRKAWRAYLRRFPKGRFVDDARAGLCRTADEESAVECWSRYRDDRPHGAYRAEADRALEGSSR